MKASLTSGLLAVLTIGTATSAHAGGFLAARFGNEYGHPTSDSVTSIYYNPAGLALGHGTRIYAEGIFVYRAADYIRDPGAIDNVIDPTTDSGPGTPSDAIDANAGKATLRNYIASPFLGAASDLGIENLGVGIAGYVPFGGQASWDKVDRYENDSTYPGAYDGPARWASIEGTQRTLYVTAAGAYRIPAAKLSFGVGLNFIRNELDLVRARNADGSDDLVTVPDGGLLEGRSLLTAKGNTFGFGAGAIYEPTPALRFGLSYQSQPGLGENKLPGTLTNKFNTGPVSDVPIDLNQELPDIIRAGVMFMPNPDLEIHLAVDYQRWSVFKDQCLTTAAEGAAPAKCKFLESGAADEANGASGIIINIPRRYDDSYGVRVGASWWVTPCVALLGGLTFDTTAIPDETMDPALMDSNKIIGNIGADIGVIDELRLLVALSHVQYFDRTIAPRETPFEAPSRSPDMAGTYKQQITFATVALGYAF
jgi:long-chain fatty acid transport protein